MTDIEKKAHDIAITFITCDQQARGFATYDLTINKPKTKYSASEKPPYAPKSIEEFTDAYQDIYDKALNQLKNSVE